MSDQGDAIWEDCLRTYYGWKRERDQRWAEEEALMGPVDEGHFAVLTIERAAADVISAESAKIKTATEPQLRESLAVASD